MSYRMSVKHAESQEICLCSRVNEMKKWAEENAIGDIDFSEMFLETTMYHITFEYDIDKFTFILKWL